MPKSKTIRGRQREEDADTSASSRVSSGDDDQEQRDEEVEEEDEGSDTAGNAVGLKVKRPSVRFTENKKALKGKKAMKGKKALKGKPDEGKLSDSSTGSSDAIRTVKLAPRKAENYEKMTQRGARRLVRAVDRSVTRLPLGYPRRTNEDFEKLIPQPIYDNYWNENDQEALETRASGDKEFTARCHTDTNVVGIWKTVHRFTGRLVTDVIGPNTSMEYRSSSAVAKLARWSPAFCSHFEVLVVHPWFNFSTAKMALAIQWAVICRTDDRRVYRLSGCDDDIFLIELVSVIQQEQDGSKSATELRELACSRHMERFPYESEPPRWSQFMEFIERRACPSGEEDEGGKGKRGPKSNKGKEPVPSDTDLWGVGVPDLKVVIVALDRMRHGRIRMFTDADTIAETFKLARDPYDPPITELIVKAIKGVYLQAMSNELRSERGAPPEVTPCVPASSPRREDERVRQSEFDEENWLRESSNDDADDEDENDDEDIPLPGPSHKRTRTAEDAPMEPQNVQKRPRGRPRKVAVSQGQPLQQPTRGPGRPPKVKTAGNPTIGFPLGNAQSRVRRTSSVVADSQSGTDAPAGTQGASDNQSVSIDSEGEVLDFGGGGEEVVDPDVVSGVVQPEVVQPNFLEGSLDNDEPALGKEIERLESAISEMERYGREEDDPVHKARLETSRQNLADELQAKRMALEELELVKWKQFLRGE